MAKLFPIPPTDRLDSLTGSEAASFTHQALDALCSELPEDCQVLARALMQRIAEDKAAELSAMQLYKECFEPLAECFFIHHGTEFEAPVRAQSRVTALLLKRLNAEQRLKQGKAPAMPDDVSEVDGELVKSALGEVFRLQ